MRDDEANSENGSAPLHLCLLGTPRITIGGQPMDGFRSTKAQALLFYVAVTGRTHTRASLASLLWGDSSDKAARGNLRKVLHQLREHLVDYLVIERDHVSLAEDVDCWVDVVEFDALISEASVAETHQPLRKAVDLYQGDFLEGFYARNAPDFENWWLVERARLRELMLESLHTLADYDAQQGDLDNAIALSRRSLRLEPWREEVHRRLMTWLSLNGQRAAALAQYEVCRQELADELGVEPAEQTTALYKRIRAGDLQPPAAPVVRPLDVAPQRPAFLDDDAEGVLRPWDRFVAREHQLERLSAFLSDGLEGQRQVALIRGEAGWGKTRLMTEFSRRARERHPDLLIAFGACTAFAGTGAPYLPFQQVLRVLCADVDAAWGAGQITRDQALHLWRALPSVIDALITHGRHLIDTFISGEALLGRAAAHTAGDPVLLSRLEAAIEETSTYRQTSDLDQTRIFGEFADVLRAISANYPLLLILDDLQWADASSIGLLCHLVDRLLDCPVLILGAYRPEEVSLEQRGSAHPLVSALDGFKRRLGDIEVHLRADEEAGREFVDALLDSEPNQLSERFRDRLARNTEGHPLFTVEMLRSMSEHADLSRDATGRWIEGSSISWEALPTRVEGVIEGRLHHLAPSLRDVLFAACVEGESFTAEVVACVCGIEETKMIRLLSEDLTRRHHLVRAGAVRHLNGHRLSRYHFSHHLFVRHLYAGLDAAERTYRHEAVGQALERLYEGHVEEVATQLAVHFQKAGRPEKAIVYLRLAGDTAAQVYAYTEAIDHYSQAIALALEAEGYAEDLTYLYGHLGRTLELASRFEEALTIYETMAGAAQQRGDRRMALTSLMARATIRSMPVAIRDPERGRSLGTRALALARELEDRAAEAKILWVLCLANQWAGRWREAIDCGERSLTIAREHRLQEQMAQTLNDLGSICYLYTGRIERARTVLGEAGELWRDLGNVPMLADSLASSVVAHMYAGEYDEAIARSDEALEISDSIDNLWGQSYSRWAVGWVFWERGHWRRAIEVTEKSIRLGEIAGFSAAQTHTRSDLAEFFGDLGAVARGLEMGETALAVDEICHHRVDRAKTLGALAHLHLLEGRLDKAEARIGEAQEDPYREAWPLLAVASDLAEIELWLAKKDHTGALNAADRLLDKLNAWGARAYVPHTLHLRGLALERMDQRTAARACLVEAQQAAEAIGSRRALWRILPALARVEEEESKAASALHRARQIVRYIADHINDPVLRSSFLNQPEVISLLEST